jgi:hypothetical protein
MSLAFNIAALTITAVVVVALAGVPVACWRERNLTRAERRAADTRARDFAASDRAGYVQRPDWGPAPVYPRHPEIPKEGS